MWTFVVVYQDYMARVIDEHILRGNAATLKCLIPSFVSDFVDVVSWETDDGETFMVLEADRNIGNQKSQLHHVPCISLGQILTEYGR